MTNRLPLPTPRLQTYFAEYALYHKTRGNKITHYFGITFIVISLLGLLGSWGMGLENLTGSFYFRIDGGTLLLAVAFLTTLFLDWKIAVPFTLVLSGLYFLGRALPTPLNWIFFVSGWILQFVGHIAYEKKSPAFLKNFIHLVIGPLWIFSNLIGYSDPENVFGP